MILGLFSDCDILYRSNKNIKHELFLSFLFHSSHNNTPFFYQTNDNDILHRPFKDQLLGWYSVWRMLPGYAYLWHLSTSDMNDWLLAVVTVLRRHPHIPDNHYDILRCKLTKTKSSNSMIDWFFLLCYPFKMIGGTLKISISFQLSTNCI